MFKIPKSKSRAEHANENARQEMERKLLWEKELRTETPGVFS
jgi:hypothetical protein